MSKKAEVDGGGLRHNKGKPQWHLLPLDALEDTVRVLEYGMKKYDKHNWKRGMDYTKILDCAQRHFNAISKGEDIDEDKFDKEGNLIEEGSYLPHIAHLLCNAIFLAYYMKDERYKEFDDRYRP